MKSTNYRSLAQSFESIERQLSRLWREKSTAEPIEADVSYNEYGYIKTVFEMDSPRLSDLAAEMKVSKPSATTMVQKLEKRGFLKRSPCPQDRRAIRIIVTKASELMLQTDLNVFALLINKLSSGLTSKEISSLEHLLSKACDCLE